ncbi:molybdenum-dependent transcriptional regulator [Pseudomonas tohonis]|uniref:Molybdenum-dependent transcriptional regulator n=2 Tax=Pseudomonas tohonis TaxID=2725477 RepID=A0A6J4DZU1_9PSED|nr:molybdenum-dependent transcriptional regulator [Pseudomonas tohonis]GJN53548.1 molybdenum-dependent transcriptional regulator [Pseudomonas tohonis]
MTGAPDSLSLLRHVQQQPSTMSQLTPLTQQLTRRPQRMALLEQIAVQGSITRAAKAAGLSYKAAWDAIDELNNLSEKPLVERSVGGKGGGGARLSAEGERLLALFKRMESLQAHLLESAESEQDLERLGRLMLRTSARNQLSGKVVAVQAQGRNDLVDVELPGGARMRAQITHDSSEKLELTPGGGVIALMKAGWLSVQPLGVQPDPQMNALEGRIEAILPDDEGPSEVRIALANGQTLCALAEPAQLEADGLRAGSMARALFAPSLVLLGTPL